MAAHMPGLQARFDELARAASAGPADSERVTELAMSLAEHHLLGGGTDREFRAELERRRIDLPNVAHLLKMAGSVMNLALLEQFMLFDDHLFGDDGNDAVLTRPGHEAAFERIAEQLGRDESAPLPDRATLVEAGLPESWADVLLAPPPEDEDGPEFRTPPLAFDHLPDDEEDAYRLVALATSCRFRMGTGTSRSTVFVACCYALETRRSLIDGFLDRCDVFDADFDPLAGLEALGAGRGGCLGVLALTVVSGLLLTNAWIAGRIAVAMAEG